MKRYIFIILFAAAAVSCGRNRSDYDAAGAFEATEVTVSAEAAGRLIEFRLSEGQALTAGTEVGIIDTTQLYLKKLQLLSARKAVGSKRQSVPTQIAAIEQQIATQKSERGRVERLVEANAANRKQLDDIEASIAVLERQLAAQRTTLESGNNALTEEGAGFDAHIAQVEDLLAKSRIVAPIDGTVLVKYAEQGEMAVAGKPLFKMADMNNMILRAYITSGQLTQLKLGQDVRVFTDFGESERREYEGRVVWISDKAEFTPKTIQTKDERANLVYAVKIAVANDGFIKIGMYGEVKFQ